MVLTHLTEISTAAKAFVTSVLDDSATAASSHDAPTSSFVDATSYGALGGHGGHMHWHTHDGVHHHHSTNFLPAKLTYYPPQILYMDPIFKSIQFPSSMKYTTGSMEWQQATTKYNEMKRLLLVLTK